MLRSMTRLEEILEELWSELHASAAAAHHWSCACPWCLLGRAIERVQEEDGEPPLYWEVGLEPR